MKGVFGLLAAGCWLSAAIAVQPGFDPKDVVRQVRTTSSSTRPPNRSTTSFDDGEFLIDTSGVGMEPDLRPAVAFDGTSFLAVWEHFVIGDHPDIFGARVSQAGVVHDPAGIAISTADSGNGNPTVAFDGTNFLVTWEDYRNGFYSDIYGARVSPAGTVLDSAGFAVSQAANGQLLPAIGFDGTNSLVVWQDYRDGLGYDIYGTRVTPAGTVLDTSGIVISIAWGGHESPAIAFDGTNYLVAWREGYWGVNGARVTQGGAVLDPTGIPITTTANRLNCPAVAFDGTNFLVAWEDCRNSPDSADIYAARVSQAGIVLDSAGIAVSTAAHHQLSPVVVFDGEDFLVAWQDERNGPDTSDIYGARVTTGGTVLDEFPVVIQEGNQLYPALCRGPGKRMFLAYQGWAGNIGGKIYDTERIWGKMDPNPAIAEVTKPEARMTNSGATIVRGVLFEPAKGDKRTANSVLLDISGRKVMSLKPGANDISRLSPGVYFCRQTAGFASCARPSGVTKVILAK